MAAEDPNIVRSPLRHSYSSDGITVSVEIYRIEGAEGWALEIVYEEGYSTVWEEAFVTDAAALAEFESGVEEQGLANLLLPDDDETATVH